MSWRGTLVILLGVLVATAAGLWLVDRALAGAWFRLGVSPEVTSALERSLEDQKQLARLDPAAERAYRRRFEATQRLVQYLHILEHNRETIVRRWELIVFATLGVVLAAAGGLHVARQSRLDARIERLRLALVALSAGQEDLAIGDRRRDTLGRIASMIEETSRAMARDRKRLAYLQNLSAWQETARRHAHEMKTPLTAARLELERLSRLVEGNDEAGRVAVSVGEELSRLGRFTQQFTSFARLPQPRLERHEVGRFLAEVVSTFGAAWGGMTLRLVPPERELYALLDRDMLRQALVNLCDNSALALRAAGGEAGTVTLRVGASERAVSIDVEDDGPGIPAAVRSRIFEPYVTTRKIGEGMGLGLAIARKLLLDHDGDLELLRTSPSGTVFRLTLPKATP